MPYDYQPSLQEVIQDESISRLQSVIEGRTGFDLPADTTRLVLHMFPESAFVDPKEYDIHPLAPLSSPEYITENDIYSVTSYIKIPHTRNTLSYTQFFQDGFLEAVDCSPLSDSQFVQQIVQYLEAFQAIGIDLPVHIRLYHIDERNQAFQLAPLLITGEENTRERLEQLLASKQKEPLD